LGVALFAWHQLLGKPRTPNPDDSQTGSLLGPSFNTDQIRQYLDTQGASYRLIEDREQLAEHVARLLADQKVVGWMQGRMEFGPRALGSRSILGDARSREMQSVMNRKIKFRESFRPFAPVILADHVHEFFEMDEGQLSPYMLLVADVNSSQLSELSDEDRQRRGVDKLKVSRSSVPAITHVDNSARVQTADPVHAPELHRLMESFYQQTGCPLLVNTSFNIRGEPIVCTPEDAHRCFLATNMDVLVIEGFVLLKDEQPDAPRHEIDAYISQFPLD
jgi:carbamoyltransferase